MKISTEWIAKAKQNSKLLRDLISHYHPATHDAERKVMKRPFMPITAGAAEQACANVRQMIAKEDEFKLNPAARWDLALEAGDVGVIYSLLSAAWFGVPESTSCWLIPGFSEAVDLLDDPPEDVQPTEGDTD